MVAVAIWDHQPANQELLDKRLGNGWEPTPSAVNHKKEVLGYARCVFKLTD